jgi:hypothetical protein
MLLRCINSRFVKMFNILLHSPLAGQQTVNKTLQGRRFSMNITLETRQQLDKVFPVGRPGARVPTVQDPNSTKVAFPLALLELHKPHSTHCK